MDCPSLSEWTALVDKEVPGVRVKPFLAHLQECPRCRREYDSLRHTQALLEQLPQLEPSARLWVRIRDEVVPVPRGFFPARAGGLRAWLATAAGLGVVSLLLVTQDTPPGTDIRLEMIHYVEQRNQVEMHRRARLGRLKASPAVHTVKLEERKPEEPNPFAVEEEEGMENPFAVE